MQIHRFELTELEMLLLITLVTSGANALIHAPGAGEQEFRMYGVGAVDLLDTINNQTDAITNLYGKN